MTFEQIFLGNIPAYPEFVALLLAYLLGGFLFKYGKAKVSAKKNAPKSKKPNGFSWDYFFTAQENIKEFAIAIIVGWAFIRFVCPDDLGVPVLMGMVFGAGLMGQAFVLDLVFEFFRSGDALKTYRKDKSINSSNDGPLGQ